MNDEMTERASNLVDSGDHLSVDALISLAENIGKARRRVVRARERIDEARACVLRLAGESTEHEGAAFVKARQMALDLARFDRAHATVSECERINREGTRKIRANLL